MITKPLGFHLKAVKYFCEEVLSQTIIIIINEKNAQLKRSAGFKRPGLCIWEIAKSLGCLKNTCPGSFVYITIAVKRFAHCCNGKLAACRDITYICHL